jgi:DNA-binding winged helix-turn-helix (wHTH) protein/Tol biopolymer transport system component
MSVTGTQSYEFGPFRLEPAERRLVRDGQDVPLPPKAFDLLVVLVSRAGRLVTKEDLLQSVWPDTFVEEASLSYTVSLLRKALQSGGDSTRYIDTVQKLGYRFAGSVRPVATGGDLPASARDQAAPPNGPYPALFSWRGAFALGAIVLAAVAAWVLLRQRQEAALPQPLARFEVPVPAHIVLTELDHPVISPDGRHVAFAGLSERRRQLWVQPLKLAEAVPLAGTDGATTPTWSPDSRSLVFFADRQLKRIDVDGGRPISLCCAGMSLRERASSLAWANGVILFSNGPVYRVSDKGGTPEAVTRLDTASHETRHFVADFLSDGRRFVFFTDAPGSSFHVASLDRPHERRAFEIGPVARIQGLSIFSGHLLYVQDRVVIDQPFDEQTLERTGAPTTLDEIDPAPFQPQPSASGTGTLVFRSKWYSLRQLTWRGRDGRVMGVVGRPDVNTHVELSPTAQRAVIIRGGAGLQNRDLWLADLTTGNFSRLTSDPGVESSPAWSPDGRRIAYHSSKPGVTSPFVMEIDTRREDSLLVPATGIVVDDWTPDGRFLVLRNYGATVFALPLEGPRALQKLAADTPYLIDQLQVSPDGHRVAYNSDESDSWEVYVARFPEFTEQRQVSVNGGVQPRWAQGSGELFYLTPDGTMMLVPSKGGATPTFDPPQVLFETSLGPAASVISQFDVIADGQRFLILEPPATRPQTFTYLLNWTHGPNK